MFVFGLGKGFCLHQIIEYVTGAQKLGGQLFSLCSFFVFWHCCYSFILGIQQALYHAVFKGVNYKV